MMSLVLRARNSPALHSKRSLLVPSHLAAQAELPGVRDDLIERRVGGQEAFDAGTGFPDRRRRARPASARGWPPRSRRRASARDEQVGGADHRVEALEGVVAVELAAHCRCRRRSATRREVVAAADGQREFARQVERVGEVDADVVVRASSDCAATTSSGPVEQNVEAVDDELAAERAELAVAP